MTHLQHLPMIAAGMILSACGLLLSGMATVHHHGSFWQWVTDGAAFAKAYVKCGVRSAWKLLLHLFSFGRYPIEFFYTEYVNGRCTLLGTCSCVKDVSDASKYYQVFDGKYVVTKTFFVDYNYHLRWPTSAATTPNKQK